MLCCLALVAAAVQETADELLRRAVAAQLAPELAGAPARPLEGFRLALNLRERTETAREVDLDLRYRRAGGRVRIGVRDAQRGTRIEKGFDGQRYWLRDDRGEVVELAGREFARDRDAIDDARGLCEDLFVLLDLDGLRERARDLELAAGEDGTRVLRGTWERGGRTWKFALELRGADLLPVSLELAPPPPPEGEPPQPRQRFVLLAHARLEGRRVPRVIEEYLDEERVYPARILEIHDLRCAEPPSPEEFAPAGALPVPR